MTVNTIVIGAGIAGLTAAAELQKNNISYILLDKAPVAGGRLATLTLQNGGRADIAAQFFTTRTLDFKTQVSEWLDAGLAFEYSTEWTDGSLKRYHSNGEPRYAIRGGMVQLVDYLVNQLHSVELNRAVRNITWQRGRWVVDVTDDYILTADSVIITIPPPQAVPLVSGIALSESTLASLKRINYPSNLTAVFAVDGETLLPTSGGIQLKDTDSPLYWIVDNKAKGISSERVITAQAERLWSKNNYGRDDTAILDDLTATLKPFLKADAVITESILVRWDDAAPVSTHPDYVLQDENLPIIFAGDGFGGRGRVEGAFLSGLEAARTLILNRETY